MINTSDRFCDGCSEPESRTGTLTTYIVRFHDGDSGDADYCEVCHEYALMDWNGDTAAIAPKVLA